MAMYSAITAAGSALDTYQTWLDTISDNMANMNTARPTNEKAYQAKYVMAQAEQVAPGQEGTGVAGIALGDATGRMVYSPDDPMADKNGYVRYPDIDLSEQMTYLIMAQRGYQANLAVVDRATSAYQAALTLGKQ